VNYLEISLLKNNYNISKESKIEELDLSKFWLVYDIMKSNYFDIEKVSKEDLVESAVF
jgi:hypothetical protein